MIAPAVSDTLFGRISRINAILLYITLRGHFTTQHMVARIAQDSATAKHQMVFASIALLVLPALPGASKIVRSLIMRDSFHARTQHLWMHIDVYVNGVMIVGNGGADNDI